MNALVTGGNGFIGTNLVDTLLSSGWNVTVLDIFERRYDTAPKGVHFIQGSVSDEYHLREALLGVDVVFHLAWSSIHEVSIRDPIADVHNNLIPAIRLLNVCCIEKVKRVVFLSSGGTIYGIVDKLPVPVTHPRRPISSYGITKLAVEEYLRMYYHLHDLEYVILRPSVPFGPRQNPFGRQGAPSVFLYRIAYGMPLTIWGDGSSTRDYVYINDLTRVMLSAAVKPLDAQRIFNVGGIELISLNDLIQVIETVVQKKAQINYVSSRPFDAPHIQLDLKQTYEILGWQPKYSLVEGLEETWGWMKDSITKPES